MRGTQYVTNVTMSFSRFRSLSLTDAWTLNFMPFFQRVIELCARMSREVQKVETWRGDDK